MTPQEFRDEILRPGLTRLARFIYLPDGPKLRRLMLAIAIQESGLSYRYQLGGPARGWWQFELAGVKGVMEHPQTYQYAEKVCLAYRVMFSPASVLRALEGHDDLAVAFARLLLWSDPAPIPDDIDSAWDYYKRNWRPGKPNRERWDISWKQAE